MRTRVALIGAGAWATQAHAPALLAQETVEVIGVVDPIIERARALAARHAIPIAVASLDALLASGRPDLVVIAAPTEAHAPLVSAALEAGIAVLYEKPLANTAAVAATLAATAEATGVLGSVGYSFRYAAALQALKRDIESGILGQPWLLELFEYNAQFHPSRGVSPGWKGDPSLARAGALQEYGSHVIDLAGWLAGPIEAVHAALARVLPDARLDDIATVQLRFRPPAIGLIVTGWVLSGGSPGIRVRFHGSEGLAEAEVTNAAPGGQAYRRITRDGVAQEVPLHGLDAAIEAQTARHIDDVVARVQGRPSPYPGTLPTLRDGARVQRVLDAALTATGGWGDIAEHDTPSGGDRRAE